MVLGKGRSHNRLALMPQKVRGASFSRNKRPPAIRWWPFTIVAPFEVSDRAAMVSDSGAHNSDARNSGARNSRVRNSRARSSGAHNSRARNSRARSHPHNSHPHS
jgi:hypothetical protein